MPTQRTEVLKPFAFEDELKEKNDRLNALNIELNLDEKDTPVMDTEPEQEKTNSPKKGKHRTGSVKSPLHICIAEIWAL